MRQFLQKLLSLTLELEKQECGVMLLPNAHLCCTAFLMPDLTVLSTIPQQGLLHDVKRGSILMEKAEMFQYSDSGDFSR